MRSLARAPFVTRSITPVPRDTLQRACSCSSTPGHRGECTACRQERLDWQRRSEGTAGQSSTLTVRRGALPWPAPGRGHAFGSIRVLPADRLPARAAPSSTLFLTDEGTETITADTATADGAAAPSADVTCGVTCSWVDMPNNVSLAATLSGTELGVPFNMIAEFSPTTIPCSCSCGEYRQYVRGEFKRNSATVTHRLCGTTLDPTSFQEDCARIGGTDYKYGYRSIPFPTSKFENPNQATGCRFVGHDYPRIRGASGDTLEINLDFYAELVDTCRGVTLTGAEWSVGGSATVP